MMHENDKIEIPEKYRKMSVSELRKEKEKIYQTIRLKEPTDSAKKKVLNCPVLFNL